MKIAVSGKGGVGKTTLSALLARCFAQRGHRVLAVDADPDANLGTALGVPEERLEGLLPVSRMESLIEERTGAKPGSAGGFFLLNPKVDDIPDRFCVETDGIRLLVMGGAKAGGSGCACPENTFLKNLLRHLVLERDDTVIVDMEAGIEHLGRATAAAVDAFVVVVEPGRRSLQTAATVARLARDIGVNRVYAVANKVRDADELEGIRQGLRGIELLGSLPYEAAMVKGDLEGKPAHMSGETVMEAARQICAELSRRLE